MGLAPIKPGLSREEHAEETRRRQKASGAWARKVKQEKNRDKIQTAIQELDSEGEKITQKKVVERTGLGIVTVKRHWKMAKFQS